MFVAALDPNGLVKNEQGDYDMAHFPFLIDNLVWDETRFKSSFIAVANWSFLIVL